MDVLLTIGEFSKMTYLSVKALRHYHDVGLLAPALVDPDTGYRRYASSQVGTAQAIRRFRDLDMPIEEVRQVLEAPDLAARNRSILVHLERMHQQLEQTQATVASLQGLLAGDPPAGGGWRSGASRRPASRSPGRPSPSTTARRGSSRRSPISTRRSRRRGSTWPGPTARCTPTSSSRRAPARSRRSSRSPAPPAAASTSSTSPATTVAVLVHDGPFADLDQTYGALGTLVAERGIGGPGPIREHYLTETSTEVCWPVTTGGPS